MSTLILVEQPRPGVVSLTLNRPEKRNALNVPLLELLLSSVQQANQDPLLRAMVLRGAGSAFCAGLDLQEARDTGQAGGSAGLIRDLLLALVKSPKVTIAAVRGTALAGGAGLMSACDLAIATAESRIGYPEVRVGMVAGMAMTLLRRQVPDRVARELLLTGETISAETAERHGLVSRAVPEEMLDETVEKMLDMVLKGAPGALTETKRFLNGLSPAALEDELQRALQVHLDVRHSEEAREGFEAFTLKRPPAWRA